jgi:hypothetical protein
MTWVEMGQSAIAADPIGMSIETEELRHRQAMVEGSDRHTWLVKQLE